MRRRPGPKRIRRAGPPPKGGPGRLPRQLNPRLQRELQRANHLMRNGNHANAAQIFINLGEGAQDLGILMPASRLFLQASMALLLANQVEDSLAEALKGLRLLAANQQGSAFQIEGNRMIEAFRDSGQQEGATQLSDFLASKGGDLLTTKIKAEAKKGIPSKCPYCGASFSLEQIQSGRLRATECKYCSSIVQAE